MKNKKATPYLDFYKKCMETGIIDSHDGGTIVGLCFSSIGHKKRMLRLLTPLRSDSIELFVNGYDDCYWGSGLKESISEERKATEFTPLRQTIVLFMAAMNNEL